MLSAPTLAPETLHTPILRGVPEDRPGFLFSCTSCPPPPQHTPSASPPSSLKRKAAAVFPWTILNVSTVKCRPCREVAGFIKKRVFVKPVYFFKSVLSISILSPFTWFWGTQIVSRSHAKTSQKLFSLPFSSMHHDLNDCFSVILNVFL